MPLPLIALLIFAVVFLGIGIWLFWPEAKAEKRERPPVRRQRVSDVQQISEYRRRR